MSSVFRAKSSYFLVYLLQFTKPPFPDVKHLTPARIMNFISGLQQRNMLPRPSYFSPSRCLSLYLILSYSIFFLQIVLSSEVTPSYCLVDRLIKRIDQMSIFRTINQAKHSRKACLAYFQTPQKSFWNTICFYKRRKNIWMNILAASVPISFSIMP